MARYTRNRKRKQQAPLPFIIMGAGLIVVSLVFMFAGPQAEQAADQQEPAGAYSPAPDLTLTSLQGQTVSLADYRGQWVLVNNWATWCPPCRAEMPELNAYYEAHKDEGFVLIGISAGDSQAEVAAFVDALGLQFPMWLDPQQKSLSAFRVNSLPNSFVIDPDGNVRMAWTGAVSLEALEARLTPLMQR